MNRPHIDYKSVKEKIKTRGYWKIILKPTIKIDRFFNYINDSRAYVERTKVDYGGWDFPHLPTKNDSYEGIKLYSGKDGSKAMACIDWKYFKECWVFYQSGQFFCYVGLREDWFEDGDILPGSSLDKVEPLSILDFVRTNYEITKFFIFAKNLSSDKRFGGKIRVEIVLHLLEGRKLDVLSPTRTPFFIERKSTTEDIYVIEKNFTKEYLKMNYLSVARDSAVEVYKYFDWEDIPISAIEKDQQKLIKGQL